MPTHATKTGASPPIAPERLLPAAVRQRSATIKLATRLIKISSPLRHEGAVAARYMAKLKALAYDNVCVDAIGNIGGAIKGIHGSSPVQLNARRDRLVEAGAGTVVLAIAPPQEHSAT